MSTDLKHISQEALQQMDRFTRANLVNSVTGIKPANLVGTISKEGISNLAIFSSVVHLGSNPPLLGMIQRPLTAEVGHSYRNIVETGYYTLNHVHDGFTENAHLSSAKFDASESEFDRCGFQEAYLYGFKAPFVAQSRLKIGLQYRQTIPIDLNNTLLVIGEILHIELPAEHLEADGQIDLGALGSVGISGLNRYYALAKTAEYPYASLPQSAR